jgi:hypothetical protein
MLVACVSTCVVLASTWMLSLTAPTLSDTFSVGFDATCSTIPVCT